MTARLIVDQPGGRREFAPSELPLVIGGPAADITIPGADRAPLAYIGLEGAEPFIQPASGGERVLCNGNPLTTSQWLRTGDEIRVRSTLLLIERQADETLVRFHNQVSEIDTEPPVIVAPPRQVVFDAPETRVKPVSFQPQPVRRSRRLRAIPHPWVLATWLVLAGLGFLAWYLFTARAVEVRVTPEPEQLEVSGAWWPLELGGHLLLHPGSYVVIAEKEGYRRLEAPLEVSQRPSQVHEYRLEKLPGFLSLVTVPSAGARVTIDGRDLGVTPLDPIELEPGIHKVEVAAGLFESVESQVEIEGGGANTVLRLELTPLWAPVTIASQPAGATVTIDGREVGKTPMTAEIVEGEHTVELRLAGYKIYRTRLDVLASQPYSPPLAVLAPADGQLILTSEPGGATVTVNGEFRGKTPLEIDLVPGIDHQVSLSRNGYETTESIFRVESGRSREVNVSLAAQYGEIEIRGEPGDSELVIDGESRGPANQTVLLTAAPHQIEVRKAGYETFSQTLIPRPGLPQVLEVKLRTEQQAREAALVSVIQGPQGQELRLIEVGTFRMGASRREPGRRANETFRDVQLTRRFYLATKEVTNREFHEFREEHRSGHAGDKSLDLDEYPVVNVTWNEAARYCNWLSDREGLPAAYELTDGTMVARDPLTNGYRLPTEAEWAWAARFAGGAGGRKYPWGESLPVPAGAGNFADSSAAGLVAATLDNYDDRFPATAPVDSFEPNAVGIFNMGGNVAEWVHDFYAIQPSGSGTVEKDPSGPREGTHHVIRGSSWMDATITELRLSFRDYGNKARPDVGFRVARYAE